METVFEDKKLGEILTESEIINKSQLEKALEIQRKNNKKLGQILVALGYTEEEVMLTLLGKKLNSPYIRLSEHKRIESEVIRSVPESIARQNILIPIGKDNDNLTVAMANPQDVFVKDILHLTTGFNIKTHICSEREIKTAINEHYQHSKLSESKCLPLNELGFDPSILALYKKYIEMSSGLILICGSNDSGKSTTLYSTLNVLNLPDKNIVSLEESIEHILDGINQVEIKPELGLSFNSGLRACLESFDADIIVVGEIKDVETAHIAVNAAEAGYLVFGVINTDGFLFKDRVAKQDSFGTENVIEFLINVGIEPYLVASTVKMVVMQKLMRSICLHCKQIHIPSVDLLEGLGIEVSKNFNFYRGQGCKFCNNTGFGGFTACFEVLTLNDKIRDLVMKGFSSSVLRQSAQKSGMITLQKAGINKVIRGETNVDELLMVMNIGENNQFEMGEELVSNTIDDFYWDIFEKTGSINAFLLSRHKELLGKLAKGEKHKKITKITKKKTSKKS